jgi:single-strand DNA-binding protein
MYNKVVLIGNVVKDPEIRSVKETQVARFRIAVDDPFREKNPVYIDCEAWAEQATFAEKWLKKGKGIIVDGRLCMDSWEKDGKKETKLFIKTSDIRFSNVARKETSETTQTSEVKQVKQKSTEKVQSEDFEDVPF